MIPVKLNSAEISATEDIPNVSNTGSIGTQQTSTSTAISVQAESPLQGLPIVQTVLGLAATRSKSMGGEIAAQLLAGSFNQLSHDLKTTKEELRQTRIEFATATTTLSETKIQTAVLRERVASFSRESTLKKLCITIGTAMIGFAIDVYRSNFNRLSFILVFAGLLLLFFGWLAPSKEAKQ